MLPLFLFLCEVFSFFPLVFVGQPIHVYYFYLRLKHCCPNKCNCKRDNESETPIQTHRFCQSMKRMTKQLSKRRTNSQNIFSVSIDNKHHTKGNFIIINQYIHTQNMSELVNNNTNNTIIGNITDASDGIINDN